MPQKRNGNRAGGVATRGGEEVSEKPRWRRTLLYAVAIVVAVGAGAGVGALLRPKPSHAVSARAQRAIQNDRNFEGRRGPWGRIEYSRIAISMPIEYTSGAPETEPTRWWFRGGSREGVQTFLAEAGLTPAQLASIGDAGWQVSAEGVVVQPPPQLVVDMSPATRARIYNTLSADEHNGSQAAPEIFYPQYVEERLESSGLSEATLGLVRKLLYPRKSWTLFSDGNVVLATLQNPIERQHFNQMVHRRMTVMAQLIIDGKSDIDRMVQYWDFRGRSKGLRSLFESLARVPGGGELDISHVLTSFARRRLYSFPEPSNDPKIWRRDCGWTALNFFSEQPDDELSTPEYAAKVLQRDYERVHEPAFGDVAALVDDDDESVHLATYLADDLTFTKNGYNTTQPWMLMSLQDLVERYSINRAKPLDVWFFRRKG
jgi:hypothetical protein